MKKLFLLVGLATLMSSAIAEDKKTPISRKPDGGDIGKSVKATNAFSIIVYERDSALTVDRKVSGTKGVITDILALYRSTFAGKAVTLSTNLITTGANFISKSFTKRQDNINNWQKTIQQELTFTKKLPMQTEIADFYRDTTTVGALDPNKMLFKGIGCRQYTYREINGRKDSILVFEIACSVDETDRGKARMLHHGKFELKVDSIRFNPLLCNLPNDSLMESIDELRIPFDWEKRKNLTFCLNATISSSWVNEAIQIYKDQILGEFIVEFSIPNESALEKDGKWKGYYIYDALNKKDADKIVSITGESFIVPRSFICTQRIGDAVTPIWGTGQYKVDMQFTETCQMNQDYYYERESLDRGREVSTNTAKKKGRKTKMRKDDSGKEYWKGEWEIIKKRKSTNYSVWSTIGEDAKTELGFKDYKWVQTLIEPIKSTFISQETTFFNDLLNSVSTSVSPAGTGGGQQQGVASSSGKQQGTNKPISDQQGGMPQNAVGGFPGGEKD